MIPIFHLPLLISMRRSVMKDWFFYVVDETRNFEKIFDHCRYKEQLWTLFMVARSTNNDIYLQGIPHPVMPFPFKLVSSVTSFRAQEKFPVTRASPGWFIWRKYLSFYWFWKFTFSAFSRATNGRPEALNCVEFQDSSGILEFITGDRHFEGSRLSALSIHGLRMIRRRVFTLTRTVRWHSQFFSCVLHCPTSSSGAFEHFQNE